MERKIKNFIAFLIGYFMFGITLKGIKELLNKYFETMIKSKKNYIYTIVLFFFIVYFDWWKFHNLWSDLYAVYYYLLFCFSQVLK